MIALGVILLMLCFLFLLYLVLRSVKRDQQPEQPKGDTNGK